MKMSKTRLQISFITARLFADNEEQALRNTMKVMQSALDSLGDAREVEPLVKAVEEFHQLSEEDRLKKLDEWFNQLALETQL